MIDIDHNIQAVLSEYHQRMVEEETLMRSLPVEEMMGRRDEFLLPVGEEVGQFLYALAKSSKSKVILEIGTSYGYSTVWLAAAAKAHGGKVITLEIDAEKANFAKSQIDKAGLADVVDFRVGDALESIKQSSEAFDFVLLDIWKSLYIPCFELIQHQLNQGAFVIADNILHPPTYRKDMEVYKNRVKGTEAFDSVLLPIGSGIEVSCKR